MVQSVAPERGQAMVGRGSPSPNVRTRASHAITRLWRLLLRPSLLLVVVGAALLAVAAGIVLPQVPGEFRNEPVATSRWLVAASSAYGPAGEILSAAGFFDVLRSPLLWLFLGFSMLLILMQGIAAAGAGLAARALPHALEANAQAGEPIPLPQGSELFRRRLAASGPPPACASAIVRWAGGRYRIWRTLSVSAAGSTLGGNGAAERKSVGDLNSPETVEQRMLGLAAPAAYWLRPLVWLGLLLGLAAISLLVNLGWQIITPTLVPGDFYRVASRDLEVAYLAPSEWQAADPVLVIRQASNVISGTVTSGTDLHVGDLHASVTEAEPSLLVSTVGNLPLLTKPGALEPVSAVGLVFPSPGSEESVLLPSLSTGLRIVRTGAPENGFLVEVYRSADIRPLRRLNITEPVSDTLRIDGFRATLKFTPLSSLVVDLRRVPSPWLLWLAAGLVLSGLAGYLLQPSFFVAQVAPWPGDRSVVILQTDRRARLDSILDSVVEVPPEPQPDVMPAPVPSGTSRGA